MSAETYLAVVMLVCLLLVAETCGGVRHAEGATASESAYSSPESLPVMRVAAAVTAAFPPEQWRAAMEVAACETGGTWDWSVAIIDSDGLPHIGLWQVAPRWWGEVPSTPEEQAAQVALIVVQHGWGPWSCRPRS